MQSKMRLLAGAAFGLLATTGLATAADAAPKHHHHASSSTSELKAEVDALRAQVQSLEATLAAQAQAQQQTQAQAAQAQAAAQAASEQAQAAQTAAASQIQTIPAQVQTAVAANRPKPGWEANTSINGRMYYNLSNIDMERDGKKIAPSGTGFDIKRFYVGIDHKFNDVFSANITTDVAYVSADSLTQVYIKKAYLQAKLNDAFVVRLGSADLPWIPYAEDMYGYRFV
jgi:multidrug efflux pump subunit AcrA (membrane-fusion protein)